MRCKSCEHLLFNQPPSGEGAPRLCSECGAPYSASDYQFRRGKVQFCCPGCGVAYYGTSPMGHLEPPQFSCVGCGLALDMDRCVLRPYGVRAADDAMLPTLVPWEGQGPWFTRWWQTARLGWAGAAIAIEPSPDSSPRKALEFLILTAWITALPGVLLAILGSLIGFSPSIGGFGMFAPAPFTLRDIAVGVAIFMLLPAYNLALAAAIAGCASVSGVPFRRGIVSCSYASGTQLLQVIPFCGTWVAQALWIAYACRGMSLLAPQGRGVAAVVATLAGVVGFGVAWFVASSFVGSLF